MFLDNQISIKIWHWSFYFE